MAPIVKVFSGALSDYFRALSKPLFAVAPTVGVVLTARVWTGSEKAFAVRPATRLSLT